MANFKELLESLKGRSSILAGRFQELKARTSHLEAEVGLAKARLAAAPEIVSVLDALQLKSHERSLGSFEKLLTAIVQDVVPAAGSVKLDLMTERGLPALYFSIQQEDSLPDDIMESSGGAVTNIVEAGIRLAALVRTKNRKLLVLDEADCWIKPSRVPSFIKVISEVSAQVGIQTLMVSHHSLNYFEDFVSYVELGRDSNGIVCVNKTSFIDKWENETTPGIRYLHLKRFKSHVDTYLPLSKGVTAVVGDNDLGKSNAINAALKAVAYNESSEKSIHRDFDDAEIEVGLENGLRLVWTRKRKGSPKVVYSLYEKDSDTPLFEGRPESRGEVPDWVLSYLKISHVEGLDVQIGYQKKPVSLLDETPSKRAAILSAGRESSHLHTLIDRYNEMKRNDKDIVRKGEIEIAQNSLKLMNEPKLLSTAAPLSKASELSESLEKLESRKESLFALVSRIDSLESKLWSLSNSSMTLAFLPSELGEVTDYQDLARLVTSLSKLEGVLAHKLEVSIPSEIPEIQDTSKITEYGKKISELLKKVEPLGLSEKIVIGPISEISDTEKLSSLLASMSSTLEVCVKIEKQKSENELDLALHEAEYATFMDEIGGVCPLCEGNINHVH